MVIYMNNLRQCYPFLAKSMHILMFMYHFYLVTLISQVQQFSNIAPMSSTKLNCYVWGNFEYLKDHHNSRTQETHKTTRGQQNNLHILALPLTVNINKIACGADHVLMASDEQAYGIGSNIFGQLGMGSTQKQIRCSPAKISLMSRLMENGIKQISAGLNHTLILDARGNVWGAGQGEFGAVGNKSVKDCSIFQLVLEAKIDSVSCGARHSLAVDGSGACYGWGDSSQGQLGLSIRNSRVSAIEDRYLKPTSLEVNGIWRVSARANISLFLNRDSEVLGCGANNLGQLGQGHTEAVLYPSRVDINSEKVTDINAGNYCLFLTQNKDVYVSGTGAFGELLFPVRIDMPEAEAIFQGETFGFIKDSQAKVYAWGFNKNGELATPQKTCLSSPTQNTLLSGFSDFHCGRNFVVGTLPSNKILEMQLELPSSTEKSAEDFQKQIKRLKQQNRNLKRRIRQLQCQPPKPERPSVNNQLEFNASFTSGLIKQQLDYETLLAKYKTLDREHTNCSETIRSLTKIRDESALKLNNTLYRCQTLQRDNFTLTVLIKQLRASLEKANGSGRHEEFKQTTLISNLYAEQNARMKRVIEGYERNLHQNQIRYNLLLDSMESHQFYKTFFSLNEKKMVNFVAGLKKSSHESLEEYFTGVATYTSQLRNIIQSINAQKIHLDSPMS